jgi:hypothetical protein
MVYRCMVFHKAGLHGKTFGGKMGIEWPGLPSDAYGKFQEHFVLDAAMRDLVSLKLTSMKTAKPDGAYWAVVCEYPQGHPPLASRRELYMVMGGDN